jgi:hypothetical protein
VTERINKMERAQSLQDFITALRGGFAAAKPDADVARVAATLFKALEQPAARGKTPAASLPVGQYFTAAHKRASQGPAAIAAVADRLAKLESRLTWSKRSAGGAHSSPNWPDGHANAYIVGPKGLEDRDDVAIGVSLLAPDVRYPDHNHGPEEIYLVLTPGRFQHGATDWFEPGQGGTMHNVPNIKHAMASGAEPLLAIWCLLLKPEGEA